MASRRHTMEKAVKDGVCTGCGKKGAKAKPGSRLKKKHMKVCGNRVPGGPCQTCKTKGKAKKHTMLCGSYL
jgi:hypothetical protein